VDARILEDATASAYRVESNRLPNYTAPQRGMFL